MTEARSYVCELSGFGVAFRDQVVLASIDLSIPERACVCLVGQAGAGKSTLLRTLAGLNAAQPALRTWGTARYDGSDLGNRHPVLVHQNARLLMATVRENLVSCMPERSALTQPEQTSRTLEVIHQLGVEEVLEGHMHEPAMSLSSAAQRVLAITRAVLSEEPLVLIDEPTTGLSDTDADTVLRLIGRVVERQSVVVVTHNQSHAKRLGGRVVLLAGGRIREARRTESFFDAPASDDARSFVATGRCRAPSPMALPHEISPSRPPPPPLPPAARAAIETVHPSAGPNNFHWLVPGRLGGLPRPGIIQDLAHDLDGLQRLKITHLVNLEERVTVPESEVKRRGIECIHFPVVDMAAPDLDEALLFCGDIDALLSKGAGVAVHCRAGMGRTGTMLTCQFIWNGMHAVEALEFARGINPRWVQSETQVAFLDRFHGVMTASPGG